MVHRHQKNTYNPQNYIHKASRMYMSLDNIDQNHIKNSKCKIHTYRLNHRVMQHIMMNFNIKRKYHLSINLQYQSSQNLIHNLHNILLLNRNWQQGIQRIEYKVRIALQDYTHRYLDIGLLKCKVYIAHFANCILMVDNNLYYHGYQSHNYTVYRCFDSNFELNIRNFEYIFVRKLYLS